MSDETLDDEAETFAAVRHIFSDTIPFNKFLGVQIESMSYESARIRVDFRDELVGNFIRGSLHGGVVSSVLDLTGGLVAFLSVVRNARGRSVQEKQEKLANVGTIDIRVDYLRPGVGKHFVSSAYLLRSGNKVAVTRMEFHNDQESLIAVGTGAYLVG
jgi:uncharacterized protein (TIGR00369 family)